VSLWVPSDKLNDGSLKESSISDGEVIPILVVVKGSDLKAIPQEFRQSDVQKIRE